MADSYLQLVDLHRSFGASQVLKGIDLSIDKGEFVTLLGPSGCGKTTTLNIVAGFLSADTGEVWIGGKEMSATPPHKRGLGMVFQNYALFPHMRVFDNVAFGLKLRKVARDHMSRKIREVMELVNMPFDKYQARFPHQLSGGEQQRISLARALVIEPSVLLLDEPLSNLDAKLRNSMRAEIRRIQKEVNITTVYVTHDQEEALAISDRVAVFQQGRIGQVASPRDIYSQPGSAYVADFVGHSNFIRGKISMISDDTATVVTDAGLTVIVPRKESMEKGMPLIVAIRAERVTMASDRKELDNTFEGKVESILYMGATSQFTVKVGDVELLIHTATEEDKWTKTINAGDTLYVTLNPADIIVLSGEE